MNSLNTLKDALSSPPVLALLNSTGNMTLETDACDVQVGRVLLHQQPDETTKPIRWWSRFLTDAESKYDTTQWECLAIVWSELLLQTYLEGARFTIRTDQELLECCILNFTDITSRLARWRLRLSRFEFDVVLRAGIKHQAADALSRLHTLNEDTVPLDNDSPFLAIDVQNEISSLSYVRH